MSTRTKLLAATLVAMAPLLNYCSKSPSLTGGDGNQTVLTDGLPTDTHRVFVSSTTHDGNFGGISGIDAYCTGLAGVAGLNRTYKALVPTSTVNVNVRINITGAVKIYNGTEFVTVASNATQFWGGSNLSQAINRTEYGTQFNGAVYTGSLTDFTFSGGNCLDWTDGTGSNSSEIGFAFEVTTSYISGGSVDCDQPQRVYCISQ